MLNLENPTLGNRLLRLPGLPGLLPQEQDVGPPPDDEEMEGFGGRVLGAAQWAGESLGKGGAAVRGVLSGLTGGDWGGGALNLIPFSDTLGITDPSRKVYTDDLLSRWFDWKSPTENTTAGWAEWLTRGAVSLAGDVVTDPMTWVNPALLGRTAAGKAVAESTKGLKIPRVISETTTPLKSGAIATTKWSKPTELFKTPTTADEAMWQASTAKDLYKANKLGDVSATNPITMAGQVRRGERALVTGKNPFTGGTWSINDIPGFEKLLPNDMLAKTMEGVYRSKLGSPLRFWRGLFSSSAADKVTTFNGLTHLFNDILKDERLQTLSAYDNVMSTYRNLWGFIEEAAEPMLAAARKAGDDVDLHAFLREMMEKYNPGKRVDDYQSALNNLFKVPSNGPLEDLEKTRQLAEYSHKLVSDLFEMKDFVWKAANDEGFTIQTLEDMYAEHAHRGLTREMKAALEPDDFDYFDSGRGPARPEKHRLKPLTDVPRATILINDIAKDTTAQKIKWVPKDPELRKLVESGKALPERLSLDDMVPIKVSEAEWIKDVQSQLKAAAADKSNSQIVRDMCDDAANETNPTVLREIYVRQKILKELDKAWPNKNPVVLDSQGNPLVGPISRDELLERVASGEIPPNEGKKIIDRLGPTSYGSESVAPTEITPDMIRALRAGGIKDAAITRMSPREAWEIIEDLSRDENEWNPFRATSQAEIRDMLRGRPPLPSEISPKPATIEPGLMRETSTAKHTYETELARWTNTEEGNAVEKLLATIDSLPAAKYREGIFANSILTDTGNYIKSVTMATATLKTGKRFLDQTGVLERVGAAVEGDKALWPTIRQVWADAKLSPQGLKNWIQQSKYAEDLGKIIEGGIPEKDAFKQLASELRINPNAVEAFKSYGVIANPKNENAFLRIYDAMNSLYKSWLYNAFPASHIRDVPSDVFRHLQEGGTSIPKLATGYQRAAQWLKSEGKKEKGYITEFMGMLDEVMPSGQQQLTQGPSARFAGIPGAGGFLKWTHGEPLQEAFSSPRAFFRSLNPLATPGMTEGQLNIAQEIGGRVRNYTDFVTRAGYYDALRNSGFSPAQAAAKVRTASYDYSRKAMGKFESDYMKRLVPFFGWTRSNVPFQLRQMLTNPGGIGGRVLAGYAGLASAAEEQGVYTPRFLQENMAIPVSDRPAAQNFFLNTVLPFQDLNDLVFERGKAFPDFLRTAQKASSKLTPPLLAPLELAAGKQMMTGRKITDLASTTEAIGDAFPFLQLTKQPLIDRVIHYSPASRVAGTVLTLADERKTPAFKLSNLLGLGRVATYDTEAYKARDLRDAYARALGEEPQAVSYEDFFIPKPRQEKMDQEDLAVWKGQHKRKRQLTKQLAEMRAAKERY